MSRRACHWPLNQRGGGDRHPAAGGGDNTEFRAAQAHEQERGAPDGAQGDELEQQRFLHADSIASSACLRSSPPAYPVSEPSAPMTR